MSRLPDEPLHAYERQTRLSRDSLETERTIRSLEFHGITIISTSDGYDSTSKSRRITRGFKNLMNEAFLDDLRDRVHRGLGGQPCEGIGAAVDHDLRPVAGSKRLKRLILFEQVVG